MATPRTVGSKNPVPQGVAFTFNSRTGYTPAKSYKGLLQGMYELSQQLAAKGVAHRFNPDGPHAEIVLESGGTVENQQTEKPIDTWQLLGNELQKDVYEHPRSLAIEASKIGSLGSVRHDIDLYNQALPPGTFAYAPAQQANVDALFALLLRGSTHYPIGQPVLKHTQIVSDRFVGAAALFSYANAERIYTTAQLLAECATFDYPLPQLYIDAINSIPTTAAAGYLWGWRKVPPTFVTAAGYKIEISTEYCSDLWSTYLYSAKA